jgi:nucleoside-diphosphate-sugar epimerase
MQAIPKGSLVLVTGVNGYIASHIAEHLLQYGYRVRGTVRDAYKADYMHALFNEKYGEDAFEVQIVKDMAADGAFDEVVKGQIVI